MTDLLAERGMLGCKPVNTSMDPNLQFSQSEGEAFARIKLSHSTPYYAQGNGQAEASKKSLKAIIEKMIKDNPRTWHNMLSEALWAYRT